MPPDSKSPQPPVLFDRPLVARRLSARPNRDDFVLGLAMNDLVDRLAPIKRTFDKPALLTPDASMLPQDLPFAKAPVARFSTLVSRQGDPLVDPETLSLPATDYDLIVSLLDIQVVNDVPGFLARLRQHLRPDGLFLAAALGGQSLGELRTAWLKADFETHGGAYARVAPFMDVRDAGALLQRAGFALPVTDIETHAVRYADPLALIRDIKALGAANPMADKPRAPVTRTHFAKADAAYPRDPDGRISASLELVWMSGWAPDDSQQKPLRPGSAKTSLATALKSKI